MKPIAMTSSSTSSSRNRKRHFRRLAKLIGAGVLSAVFLHPQAYAASGTWNVNATGNWSLATNWAGSVIADGAGFTADFSKININAGRTVTIDTTPRTIGVFTIGDLDGTNNYVIAASGGGTLTFNNGGSGALLNQLTGANSFTVPINLADNLSVTNSGTAVLTISGGITSTGSRDLSLNANGNGGLTLSTGSVNHSGSITNAGSGTGTAAISSVIGTNVTGVVQDSATSQLSLTGANTFTTGVTVKKGNLLAGSNAALGTGIVTLGDTSGTNNATLLVGSSTFANSIVVQAGSANNTLTIASSGGAAARPTGNILLNNNLNLTVDSQGTGRSSGAFLSTSGTITGSGNLNLNVTGGMSTTNNTGQPQMDSLTVLGPVAITGTISNIGTGAGRAAINGNITSAAGLVQNSATSMLSLGGTNTYAGATSVNAGVLRVTTANALSANSVVTVGSGGSLQLATGSSSSAAGLYLAGNGTSYSYGALLSVNNANYGGPIVLNDNATITSDLASTTLTLGGGITGAGKTLSTDGEGLIAITGSIATGSGGLVKGGPGSTTLSAANTFTGVTQINQGALVLNHANALGGGGNITFDGGTLRHTGSNTLDMGSRIVNSSGPIAIDTNAQNVIYSNIGASNTGGLTKLGTGRLTLSGVNAFSGPVNVNTGVLAVSAVSALGTGQIFVDRNGALNSGGAYANVQSWLNSGSVSSSSTGAIALTGNSSESIDFTGFGGLSLGASSNSTYTGVITPAGSLYRLGGGGAVLTLSNNDALTGANGLVVNGGNVVLTGSNSLTGATSVNSNTLTLSGNAGALANSSVTVNPGATLSFVSGNSATPVTRANDVILSRGTLLVSGTTAADITHNIAGNLTIGAGGNSTITVTGNASRDVVLNANAYTRQAGGTALIRGTNLGTDWIGTNNMAHITFANPNLVGGDGTLGTNHGIFVGAVGDTLANGTGFGATGGLLTYDSTYGVRLLGSGEYKNSITNGQTQLDNILLSQSVTGTTTTTLTDNTTVNSLSLRASGTSAAGVAITGAGTITLNSGVIYAAQTAGTVSVSNALDFNGREAVILSSFANNSLQLSGVLGNTGGNGLTIAGSGTVSFSGALANTYTGTTTVNSGVLTLNKTAGQDAVTGDLVINTGGRVVYSASHQINDASDIFVNGGLFNSSGTETVDNFTLNSAGTATVDTFTVSRNLTVSGSAAIDNTIGGTFTVSGTTFLSDGGNLTVHRANSPSGAFDTGISLGAVNITNTSSGAYSAIILDHGSNLGQNGGKIVINGDLTFMGNSTNSNTVLIDALKGAGRQGVIGLNGTRVFDIGNGAAKVDLRITAGMVNDASAGGLTKNGQGALELTGVSTYTGPTTVNAGTLLLNGSLTSAVTVNGGSFTGTGATTGSLAIGNSGTLAPGNSPGTLSTGSLSLTGTAATISMEIAGTTTGLYDQINVTGGVSLDGNGKIEVTMLSFVPQPTDVYFLILNDGLDAISGTLYGIAQGDTFTSGGYTWQVSYTGNSATNSFTGGNDLALQIIPEPATWMLITGGLMAVTFMRRRRSA